MLDKIKRKSMQKSYQRFDMLFSFDRSGGLCDSIWVPWGQKQISSKLRTNNSFSKKQVLSFMKFDLNYKGILLNMIYCPKGSFTMGHQDQEDNQPRPEIIERPFLLGETEVTQELYEAVMGASANLSEFQNPQNPVEKVSWGEAILFCNALSKLQGLDVCYKKDGWKDYDYSCDSDKNGYRLPTEKEWEYAAKAGSENRWAGTDNQYALDEYAVYSKDSIQRYGNQTYPVKSKTPNAWGLYDMSGNVAEWCWDRYVLDESDDQYQVIRGGGFTASSVFSRSASRDYAYPGSTYASGGFRICRSVV